jgi:hypothetical protein
MKVGGGLNYVVGPMGSGKSLYGVRHLVERVLHGEYVVTNIELYPNAPERIARHVAPLSRRRRRKVADTVRRYYVYETDLAEAMRYRLPPQRKEARGAFIWDEGHNDLNNRNWRDGGRGAILEWATQLRKLGYVGFLLSQHADNTDAALRRVCNFLVKLQNQREQTRAFGLRVTPWPLFLAVWYPAHLAQGQVRITPSKTERYFLTWHRHLYDTFGLYHGLAEADGGVDLIQLPSGGREAPETQTAAPGATPSDAPNTIECMFQVDETIAAAPGGATDRPARVDGGVRRRVRTRKGAANRRSESAA